MVTHGLKAVKKALTNTQTYTGFYFSFFAIFCVLKTSSGNLTAFEHFMRG